MVAVAGSGRSGGGVPKLKKMTAAELAGAGEDDSSRRRGRGNPSAHGWTVVGGGGEDEVRRRRAEGGGRRPVQKISGAPSLSNTRIQDRLLLKRRRRLLVLSFFRHEANSIPIHQTTEIHEF